MNLESLHRKLDRNMLLWAFDNEYAESNLRTSNFYSKNVIYNYIDFEFKSEKNDTLNRVHNYGRQIQIPIDINIIMAVKKKAMKSIINKAITRICYDSNIKKVNKFFAWIDEDNHFLNIVIIERCTLKKGSEYSAKNVFFKSADFFNTSILVISNTMHSILTNLNLFKVIKQNVKKETYSYIMKNIVTVMDKPLVKNMFIKDHKLLLKQGLFSIKDYKIYIYKRFNVYKDKFDL